MAYKLVGFRVDENLARRLKFAALRNELTIQELLARAIEAYLDAIPKKKQRDRPAGKPR